MKPFLNRKQELAALEASYLSEEARLVVLYGRRRVGKTSLIIELIRRHEGLYLLGRQETELENLRRFSEEIAAFFDDEVVRANPFRDWDALLIYLAGKLKGRRFILALDEFPYLVAANKSLPSIIQDHWDSRLSKEGAYLILCGSSIGMMEESLGYRSPLYGRRTEQMLLEPLSFKQAQEFFPRELAIQKRVEYYAILGGTPAYLLEFDYAKSIEHNLLANCLQKSKFLHQDALFVLREELSEPRNYFAILRTISLGRNTLNEIVNETGLDRGLVSKYISVLIELHLVERLLPLTEKKNSRKGIYRLRDNFFRFWFRFVHGNEQYLEQGRQEVLLKEKVLPSLNTYLGGVFEDIALEFLASRAEFREYLFGRWWHRDTEIDIVGTSKKSVLFIEVKWKDLTYAESVDILRTLKGKAEGFQSPKNAKQEYGLIAKHVDRKGDLRKDGHLAFDLDDF